MCQRVCNLLHWCRICLWLTVVFYSIGCIFNNSGANSDRWCISLLAEAVWHLLTHLKFMKSPRLRYLMNKRQPHDGMLFNCSKNRKDSLTGCLHAERQQFWDVWHRSERDDLHNSSNNSFLVQRTQKSILLAHEHAHNHGTQSAEFYIRVE